MLKVSAYLSKLPHRPPRVCFWITAASLFHLVTWADIWHVSMASPWTVHRLRLVVVSILHVEKCSNEPIQTHSVSVRAGLHTYNNIRTLDPASWALLCAALLCWHIFLCYILELGVLVMCGLAKLISNTRHLKNTYQKNTVFIERDWSTLKWATPQVI